MRCFVFTFQPLKDWEEDAVTVCDGVRGDAKHQADFAVANTGGACGVFGIARKG